jgi:gliding motility-associated-like protein
VELYAYSEFGCFDSSIMTIKVVPDVLAYISNSFTPNDDNHNNEWLYSFKGIVESTFEVTVFNRWGEVVFETESINDHWNGTYRGQIVPDCAYSHRITANSKYTGERLEWLGSLLILK